MLAGSDRAVDLREHAPPAVLIPLERWDSMARRAVQVAARMSPDVTALHLTDLEGPEAEDHETCLREEWARFVEGPAIAAGLAPPELVVAASPYRSVLAPVLREVAALRRECPGRPIVVVIGELAGGRWWEAALHTRRAQRLRTRILASGGPDVSVLVIPWVLEARPAARVLAEEEPQSVA